MSPRPKGSGQYKNLENEIVSVCEPITNPLKLILPCVNIGERLLALNVIANT